MLDLSVTVRQDVIKSRLKFMNQVAMKGLTGNITFDQHGLRTDFELEVIELKKEGLVKVGAWTEKGGMNFTRNFTESYSEIVESLQNKTLIVTTIKVMWKFSIPQ